MHLHTILKDDEIVLISIKGSVALSELPRYEITCSSFKSDVVDTLMNTSLQFVMTSYQDSQKVFKAEICTVRELRKNAAENYTYEIIATSHLARLQLQKRSRIYQNKTTIEIVTQLLREWNFHDFRSDLLKKTYAKRDYCVQYQESDFDFIQRLLAEEGVAYCIQSIDHLLLLDSNAAAPCFSNTEIKMANQTQSELALHWWRKRVSSVSTDVSVKNYDFKQPRQSLYAHALVDEKSVSARYAAQLEQYSYPDSFSSLSEGQKKAVQYAERINLQQYYIEVFGNYADMYPCLKFQIDKKNIPEASGKYLIVKLHFEAHVTPQSYRNFFLCLPESIPFHPPLVSKPVIPNCQMAIVTGESSSLTYTDVYGRIKVLFTWDTYHEANQESSTWLRCLQTLAGCHAGMQFIPRPGNQVIVGWVNGDIDRPMVIGSHYTESQHPPVALPQQKQCSVIKTQAQNEIQFNSESAKEQLSWYAKKDLVTAVGRDSVTFIAENQEIVIEGSALTALLSGSHTTQAQQGITLAAGSSAIHINQSEIEIFAKRVTFNS